MENLKKLRKKASVNRIIAYTTDLVPFIGPIQAFIVENHPRGDAFSLTFETEASDLLELAGKADQERIQMLEATVIQDKAFREAVAMGRRVKNYGSFLAEELEHDPEPENKALSHNLKTACCVSKPTNYKQQSSVRRLLTAQMAGFQVLSYRDAELEKLSVGLDKALKNMTDSAVNQAAEKAEADFALNALTVKSETAIETINRAIRLFKAFRHKMSEELFIALRGLQGVHHDAFYSAPKNKNKE